MALASVSGYSQVSAYREGGSAHVYKALRDRDGRAVALKIIKPDGFADKALFKAFVQEAEIMSELHCRSVVKVFEFRKDARPRPAIVMEFFPSENLKVLLYQKPAFVRSAWFPTLWEVAGALMYIHEHGVIHRDVKPENVLVNGRGIAKLIDFSLAVTRRIKPKKVAGTPAYIAPEQIERKKLTQSTDIYAFGVVIYELVAGRPPFVSSDATEVLRKHLEAVPAHLSKAVPGTPRALANLVARMLAKSPKQRPKNMREVMGILKSVEDETLPAVTPSASSSRSGPRLGTV